jgi:NAD(P)-dependent dehydrogenase (short-subunit alcohol dehydrogenase family)
MSSPARVALVSGGGRGIGRAISLGLARNGFDVAVNFRRDADAAAQVVDAIHQLGRQAISVGASVDDFAADQAMVAHVVDELGPPSLLVHNSGMASRGLPVVETDPGELLRVFGANAFGAFYLAKLCLPYLTQHERSDIIVISSTTSRSLPANSAPYSMAKAAVEALAMTLAKEARADGVHVNVVAPGLVATEMGDRLVQALTAGEYANAREMDGQAPFGRVCRPEDVADVVCYLASQGASYLTGVRIPVDGGDSRPAIFMY